MSLRSISSNRNQLILGIIMLALATVVAGVSVMRFVQSLNDEPVIRIQPTCVENAK